MRSSFYLLISPKYQKIKGGTHLRFRDPEFDLSLTQLSNEDEFLTNNLRDESVENRKMVEIEIKDCDEQDEVDFVEKILEISNLVLIQEVRTK